MGYAPLEDSFSLPILRFAPSLQLSYLNAFASTLFGISPSSDLFTFHASFLFDHAYPTRWGHPSTPSESDDALRSLGDSSLRARLISLDRTWAKQHGNEMWGADGTTLEYWTGWEGDRVHHAAEVIVHAAPDGSLTLLFVRPLPHPRHGHEDAHSNRRKRVHSPPLSPSPSVHSTATGSSIPPSLVSRGSHSSHSTAESVRQIAVDERLDQILTSAMEVDVEPTESKEHDLRGAVEFLPQMCYIAQKFEYTGLEKDSPSWASAFHADDLGEGIKVWEESIAQKKPCRHEYRVQRHDGVWRWHVSQGAPIWEDGEIVRWVNVITDIQDLKDGEEERLTLRASEEAAKEASRLKTEFVTNISHEIRTPISGIMGICELLADDITLHPSHRNLISKAVRTADVLLDLVGLVLDMGAVEAGKLTVDSTPFRLSSILEDASLFSIIAAKHGVAFIEDVEDFWQGELLGDPRRLRQVLTNAIGNSVKFTANGEITLRVRQDFEPETHVVIILEVEDTGIGIHEDVLPLLFTPFKQADTSTARRFGGTGLGLIISKQLVELMGGTITMSSQFDKGTTFTVRLTFEKAPEPLYGLGLNDVSDRERRSSDPGFMFKPVEAKYSILLAEDNTLLQEIVSSTLRKMMFKVTVVSNGREAIEAVRTGSFDLVLMDGQMPEMDGYEATVNIRRLPDPHRRSIKMIALTASAISGDKERCITSGMDSYLSKPCKSADLRRKILEHLEPGAFLK